MSTNHLFRLAGWVALAAGIASVLSNIRLAAGIVPATGDDYRFFATTLVNILL